MMPSNEKHPKDSLPAYLAGDLSPEEQRRVEAHLETCSECAEELHELSKTYVALIESLPSEAPPARVWDAIENRIASSATIGREDEAIGRAGRIAVDRDQSDESPEVASSPRPDTGPRRTPLPRPARSPVWHTLALAASLLVAAIGVIWGVDRQQAYQQVLAEQSEITRWLAQPGIADTFRDTMFNSLGALLVAVFVQVHLTDTAQTVQARFFA
jgi:anti-sigma factor RsiW